MRIAMVNDTFLKGRGVDIAVFELAQRIGKTHEVTVITTQADFPEKNFKIQKIKGQKLVTGGWKDFLGVFELLKYRKFADEFDIINLHHGTISPAFIGKNNVFVTYHGSPPPTGEKGFRYYSRKLANQLAHFSMRFNNSPIIAISKNAKIELRNLFVPKQKIKIIYPGMDALKFETLKDPKDDHFMFFVGRQEHHKHIEEIIKISAELNFPLKIAGDGPEIENLRKTAKDLKAPVEFLGKVPESEKIKLFQTCSFFISASKWENWGLIFIEAAACGKASIGYNMCSIPEVIKHEKTGFLANNYEELKKSAEILINDKKLRKKLGKTAYLFSKKFSWDKTADNYTLLFKKLNNIHVHTRTS